MMNSFIKNHLNVIKKNKFSNPELELRVLLSNCSINKDSILLHNFNISNIDIDKFKSAFERRINNEPISKIFNKKEFWSLDFYVNRFVLDPRPESEFIIQEALKYYSNLRSKIKICDLGTGSGCLAISLAKIYFNSQITVTDISHKALNVAKKNALKHKVEKRIKFINCDWFTHEEKFDFIVSNPPYLSDFDYKKSNVNIKNFEPKIALSGGFDGFESYRKISNIITSLLYKKSLFFLEVGKSQSNEIKNIFMNKKMKLIEIIKDYQQIERVLVFQKA